MGSNYHQSTTIPDTMLTLSTPAVTFTFYNNGICDGTGTAVANIGPDEVAAAVRSAASAALGAGSYSCRGAVAGNANYFGDSSDCAPFAVDKAQLTVNTQVHDADHENITND